MQHSNFRMAAVSGLLKKFSTFEEFELCITGHVRYAADYKSSCILFPEFSTCGLAPIKKDWSKWRNAMIELSIKLSKKFDLWICAGSMLHLEDGKWKNTATLVSPDGNLFHQQKMHPTPYERMTWKMKPSPSIRIVETPFAKIAMAVCYDIEFPEAIRAAAVAGADVILVPSWTDDETGYVRVRTCAAARCIENSVYVLHAPLVGSMPEIPGFEEGVGRASILTPSDLSFPRFGIAMEGAMDQEQTIVSELSLTALTHVRHKGSVTPMLDRHTGIYDIL
jgi:predicted amidohydrolase